MPLPLVGAHAVLEGVPQFSKDADTVNNKVGAINKTMGGMGGVAQKAGGLVSGALKTMAKAGVGAVAGIGAVGAGIAKLAYDASVLPGIESVFKNMTQSMGVDADALMTKMRNATYGAVKDFDLMKSANKAMVGAGEEFGKMFAESLPTLMTVSREAAKAQGLSVEYMYDSIVTGVKRMSPMILDNLGFQLSLTEANEKYAASVGKTSKELTKEEKQMALLSEVLRAGNQLIDETGGHVDSVQKDVLAWGTALANVKDRVGIELVPILQKFMDLIGKPTQGMQDKVVGIAKAFVDWLVPAIDTVALSISTLMSGPVALLIKGFSSLGTAGLTTIADSIKGIFTGDIASFEGLGSILEGALTPAIGADLAKKIAGKAVAIAEAVRDGLAPIRDWVSDIVGYVKPKLEVLAMYFKMFVEGVITAFRGGGIQKILDAIKGSLMVVFGINNARMIISFGEKFKGVVDLIVEHSDLILSALKGIAIFLAGKQITGALSSMATSVKGIFGGVGKSALGLLSPMGLLAAGSVALAVAWDKNWFGIQDKTKQVVESIKKSIPFATDALGGLGQMIVGVFTSDLEKAGEGSLRLTDGLYGIGKAFGMTDAQAEQFSQTIGNVISNVVDFAKSIYDTVAPVIAKVGDIIGGLFSGGGGAATGGLQDFLSNIFDQETVDGIMKIVGLIQEIVPQIGELIANAFNTVLAVAQAVWPYVQEIITVVWDAISEVIKIFVTEILPPLLEGFLWVLNWVNDNWPAIQAVIVEVFRVIAEVITAVLSTVIPWAVDLFSGLVDWVTENWPMISEAIGRVMGFIGEIIAFTLKNIQAFWEEHGDNIIAIITAIWDIIKAIVETAINIIKDIIIIVCSIINGDWEAAWNAVKDIVFSIWELIKTIVDAAIRIVLNTVDVVMGLIKLSWSNIWDAIKLIAEVVWNGIKTFIEWRINTIKDTIANVMGAIQKAWNSVWDGLKKKVEDIWNSIISFICNGVHKAIGLFNKMIDAVNKIPGVDIPEINVPDCGALAQGGILNKPVFVAGEAGAEVVAPLGDLVSMIKNSFASAISDMAYRAGPTMYSGPTPGATYNYGGDTYVREYNLTTNSVVRPGTLAMEFSAMELAHA